MSRAERVSWIAIGFALLAGAASAAPAGERMVAALDTVGRRVELAAPASRIVSLSAGATEILAAIGAGSRVVADFPGAESAADAPDLLIVEEKPTSPEIPLGPGRRPAVYVHAPLSLKGLADSMMALGVLVGKEEEGIRAAASLSLAASRLRSITVRMPSSGYPRVFWESSEEPLATCGADSLAHELIVAAGGRDLFSDRLRAESILRPEEVVERKPELILVVGSGGETAVKKAMAAWADTPAGRSGRIVALSPELASRAGPRTAAALLALARYFHPDLVP